MLQLNYAETRALHGPKFHGSAQPNIILARPGQLTICDILAWPVTARRNWSQARPGPARWQKWKRTMFCTNADNRLL